MASEKSLRKNLVRYQRELSVPIIPYLLTSVIFWIIIGCIMAIMDYRDDLSQITGRMIFKEAIFYGIGGTFFGIIMRWFSGFQAKQISKELNNLEQSDKD